MIGNTKAGRGEERLARDRERPRLRAGSGKEWGMSAFRYKGFVSYSWADAKWGKWVHHALETYRTPAALIGKEGRGGPVPARLHPLFKDREEEAAGASIGAAVESALAESEFLIVVCSPRSAQSEWVNREIAWFKTHRDPDKVLALIVDGEPGSADAECFPAALTHEIAEDLSIGAPLADAPLAADARDSGDGKRRARLKIAAAMLGVGLDELVNRDERRRTLRTRVIVTASLVLAMVMSGMAWFAVEQRNEAERQRNEADGLVEFMLTDLREKLEPVGRLDALDVVGERALDYYASQKLGALDADSLGRRARALHLVGEISNLRGDSEEALRAFREAAASTAEQLARDPDNTQRIFDHSQSVFWVGAIAYSREENDEAEARFRDYQRLARRLVEIEPAKSDWQLESSYAETNIGVMLHEQRRHEEAEPAFAKALERIEAVAAGEAYDAGRQVEIGTTANWLALTKDRLAKYDEARVLYEREAGIYHTVLSRDPANAQAKYRLSVAQQFLADQLLNTGKLDEARETVDRALANIRALRTLEPDNTEYRETEVRSLIAQAEHYRLEKRHAMAARHLAEAEEALARLRKSDMQNAIWSGELRYDLLYEQAWLAIAQNRGSEALAALDEARTFEAALSTPLSPYRRVLLLRTRGDALQQTGQETKARDAYLAALERLPDEPRFLPERFLLLSRLGRASDAREIATLLDRQGYLHPAYQSGR